MTNRHFNLFMMWIIPLIFTVIGPFSVVDIAGWIAHGNFFLDRHQILKQDVFSVLPTAPLVYPSWGISIVYALIYRMSNLTAVCLFHTFLISILLGLIYRHSISRLADPSQLIARLSVYFVWLGAVNVLGERPSMVALIPLILAYFEIEQVKSISDFTLKRIIQLCFINLLWVNIHGSFVLLWFMTGWKLFFLAIQERKILKPTLIQLTIGISSLINPFGYRVFGYVINTARHSQHRLVPEWAPTTPWAQLPTGLAYFALAICAVALVSKRSRRAGFVQFISSPFFLLLLNGLTAIRNAALPFIVLLPFLKEHGLLNQEVNAPKTRPERPFLNLFSTALFLLIFVLVLPPFKPLIASLLPSQKRSVFDSTEIPEIVQAIKATRKTCPIFNAPDLGSFLLLKLPNQVFLDSRNIIYSDEEFQDYAHTSQAQPGWERYLDRYHACFAVLDEVANAPLIQALQRSSGWRSVIEEKGNILFEKTLSWR